MKFSTVTLAPAVDVTVTVDKFPESGDVLKVSGEIATVGGKGLNSARWLAFRGKSVLASGILGNDKSEQFSAAMKNAGIEDAFLRVDAGVRVNEMFTSNDGMFKVNRPAYPDLNFEPKFIDSIVSACISFSGVCVLAGSLPAKFPANVYAEIIERLHQAGVRVVLDTSGEALCAGYNTGLCSVIKPNREESAALLGYMPGTPADFKKACRVLLDKSACVIISDGAGGCWFADRSTADKVFHVPAPCVDTIDTTGAGDTLLAEFCCRYFPEQVITDEVLMYSCAAGAASTTMPGAALPPASLVDELAGRV